MGRLRKGDAGAEAVSIRIPIFPVIADISPSLTELLVIGGGGANEPQGLLWILPVPGGSLRRLGDLLGHSGTCSPDGLKIVYCKGHDLLLVNTDGSESRKLVTVPGRACGPRCSPDGSQLRFMVEDPKAVSWKLWEVAATTPGEHHRSSFNGKAGRRLLA